MRLLIIGGTQFVGRHLVETALALGHKLTLFNRGQTAHEPVPGIDYRHGDRQHDLGALSTGEWDAVIDCCAYLPRDVAAMADALRGRVSRYVFISSVSVYADFKLTNAENSPLGRIDDPDTEVIDGGTYGPLKALCEQALQSRFGDAVLMIRPGLVVGPHDPTQRFTYWPSRIAAATPGEAVLLPGNGDEPVQFVDARDLAAFILRCVDKARVGVFNVVSPPRQWTMRDVADACAVVAGTQPRFVPVSAAVLEVVGVNAWNDIPLWWPPDGEQASFALTQTHAAQDAGLHIRPLAHTIADTLAWWRSLPGAQQAFTKAGLSRERERELLRAAGHG